MNPLGLLRIAAASLPIRVADPQHNANLIVQAVGQRQDCDVVLLPELCLTGYTCGDLFGHSTLLDAAMAGLIQVADQTADLPPLVVVGLPIRYRDGLLNCAAVLHRGELLGLVPKLYLPNYQEFYEARWFQTGSDIRNADVELGDFGDVPLGVDLLFKAALMSEGAASPVEAVIGIELCEDLWMPVPPSSLQALAGATVLLNLSASNETIGKSAWREQLVTSQSGRCFAAYAYASAGPTESTTDVVFGGHCLIAENGRIVSESSRVGDGTGGAWQGSSTVADVDLAELAHNRQISGTFHQAPAFLKSDFRHIAFDLRSTNAPPERQISGAPFVPADSANRQQRCREILDIQSTALTKRLSMLPASLPLTIGVSGGLDSTLALLVAVQACQNLYGDATRIHPITMPGFGTSERTLENANRLMRQLGLKPQSIDIRELCLDAFRAIEHAPFGMRVDGQIAEQFQAKLQTIPVDQHNDLIFENVQARIRTLMLMSSGFVLGTGDLSESALGWCTYNGDHMSMYNVNASIPKTLVKYLIAYFAEHQSSPEIQSTLQQVLDTPISPELLPLTSTGEAQQATEVTLGPYELHDFFLYYLIRHGASPRKILYLARYAIFSRDYTESEIRSALQLFLNRFFANQFKRSCVPDGPKVGSVSLSPRGDWRMPSDAVVAAWIADLES